MLGLKVWLAGIDILSTTGESKSYNKRKCQWVTIWCCKQVKWHNKVLSARPREISEAAAFPKGEPNEADGGCEAARPLEAAIKVAISGSARCWRTKRLTILDNDVRMAKAPLFLFSLYRRS